jgi:hypothetical protein
VRSQPKRTAKTPSSRPVRGWRRARPWPSSTPSATASGGPDRGPRGGPGRVGDSPDRGGGGPQAGGSPEAGLGRTSGRQVLEAWAGGPLRGGPITIGQAKDVILQAHEKATLHSSSTFPGLGIRVTQDRAGGAGLRRWKRRSQVRPRRSGDACRAGSIREREAPGPSGRFADSSRLAGLAAPRRPFPCGGYVCVVPVSAHVDTSAHGKAGERSEPANAPSRTGCS